MVARPTRRVKAVLPVSRLPYLADTPKALRPYAFHGVELNWKDVEWARGTCPFCLKDSHFFVKVEDGRFKCQRCPAEGNTYTFMELLFQQCLKQTTPKELQALSENRGVSIESLQALLVAWDSSMHQYVIPGYNTKGTLANLSRCLVTMSDRKLRLNIRGTPDCKIHPLGPCLNAEMDKPYVFVLEGLWDACAIYDKLINASDAKGHDNFNTMLLPAPAAGNFQAEWFHYMENKDCALMFDNDHPKVFPPEHEQAGELMMQRGQPVRPGWDGMQRIVKLANTSSKKPKSLRLLYWNKDGGHNPELPDGYDVRDHLLNPPPELPGFVSHGLGGLLSMLADAKIQSSPTKDEPKATVTPIERTTFEELVSDYEKAFHVTQNVRDTLAIMLAVILSTESEPINHLWLRVIGPPGSLKSTLAEAVSAAREYVNPKSILTGFHSGYLDPRGDGESSSIIPQFNRKTGVIKDADTLSNSPNKDQILRELRDFYDGTSRSVYRNRAGDEFEDIRISFILCGTDELRNLNRTFLGERFIDCEIIDRGEDTRQPVKRVVRSTYENLRALWQPKNGEADDHEEPQSPAFIKAVTYGFIKYLKENYKSFQPPEMDERTAELVEAMGILVAKIRARNKRDQDLTYRPRTELGTRPGAQFTKLAIFLASVLQKPTVDEEVLRIVRKVVRDTCVSFQYDIVKHLAETGEAYLGQICSMTPTSETNVRRYLNDMQEFGIVQRRSVPNNSGQRGRDRHVWQLSPLMVELWQQVFPPADIKSPARPSRRTSQSQRRAPLPTPTRRSRGSKGSR